MKGVGMNDVRFIDASLQLGPETARQQQRTKARDEKSPTSAVHSDTLTGRDGRE